MRIPYRPSSNISPGGTGARISGTVLAQSATRSLPVWKGLGDVAGAFGAHAEKMQDRQNEHDILEAQASQAQILADFENDNRLNQDPQSLISNYDSNVIPMLKETVSNNYSPVVQEQLKRTTSGLINQNKIRTGERASLMQIDKTRGLSRNIVDQHLGNANYDGAMVEVERGINSGIYSPHKGQEMLDGIEQSKKDAYFNNSIESDPHGLVEGLESGAYIKNGDLTEEQNNKKLKQAISKRASVDRGITSDIADAIYLDDIETVGDLQGFEGFDKLSETNQRKLVKSFQEMQEKEKSAIEKARSNAPRTKEEIEIHNKNQKIRITNASILINRYDTSNLDDTDEYVDIQNHLNGIENVAERERLKNRLTRKLNSEKTGRKTKSDRYNGVINDFYKKTTDNFEKPKGKEVRRTIRQHLDDGFFDKEVQNRLGITDKDVEYINKAKEDVRENETFIDDVEHTHEAKIERFKKVWLRKRENVTASEEEIELANAVFNSKEGGLDTFHSKSIEFEEGAQEAYDAKKERALLEQHKVLDEYNKWAEDNTSATSDEHEKKIRGLNNLMEGALNRSYDDTPINSSYDNFDPYEFTFNAEARFDRNGNLSVYNPPKNDGGGSFEVAGITERWQRADASRIRSLVQQGKFAQAKTESKRYYKKISDPFTKHTKDRGIKLQLADTVHHRGPTGLKKILQRATGTKLDDSKALIKILESNPNALNAFNNARVRYEAEELDNEGRAGFRKGLIKRFKNAHNAAKTANRQ